MNTMYKSTHSYLHSTYKFYTCLESPVSNDSSDAEEESTPKYSYFVCIINPKKINYYVVQTWHDVKCPFDTPRGLKEKLVEHFPGDLPVNLNFEVGYFGYFEGRENTNGWIFEAHL